MRKRCAIDSTHFLYSYVTAKTVFREVPLQSWQKMFQIVDYNLKISVNHVQLCNVKCSQECSESISIFLILSFTIGVRLNNASLFYYTKIGTNQRCYEVNPVIPLECQTL